MDIEEVVKRRVEGNFWYREIERQEVIWQREDRRRKIESSRSN